MIRRSILAQSIHELWGKGANFDEIHQSVKQGTLGRWGLYKKSSFKFDIESYQGSRSKANKLAIINSFSYLPFEGPIKMSNPDESFTVFDVWPYNSVPLGIENPDKIYFGRYLATSSRDVVPRFDLKKRDYISTTSMDSELSLVTANIALASPGKLFYDPFVGTGSFPVACAHFGAMAWGSDIDGRSIRGEGGKKSLQGNFEQYGLRKQLGDVFAADLTHTPLRKARLFDGIVCDPPYGVREGLRVLGCRDPEKMPWVDRLSREKYMYEYPICKSPRTKMITGAGTRTMCPLRNRIASWLCWTIFSSLLLKHLLTMGDSPFGCQQPTTQTKRSRSLVTHV